MSVYSFNEIIENNDQSIKAQNWSIPFHPMTRNIYFYVVFEQRCMCTDLLGPHVDVGKDYCNIYNRHVYNLREAKAVKRRLYCSNRNVQFPVSMRNLGTITVWFGF